MSPFILNVSPNSTRDVSGYVIVFGFGLMTWIRCPGIVNDRLAACNRGKRSFSGLAQQKYRVSGLETKNE
jgi:hypothetical protein